MHVQRVGANIVFGPQNIPVIFADEICMLYFPFSGHFCYESDDFSAAKICPFFSAETRKFRKVHVPMR